MNKISLVILLISSVSYSAAPKCLKKNIEFWTKVYTEYSDTTLIFHNVDTFEVYSVVEGVEIDSEYKKLIIVNELKKIEATDVSLESLDNVRIQRGAKEKWIEGINNSKTLLPMIKKVFKKQGIPLYIAYLPAIESGFNVKAGSRVGAKGLWQIMPTTAKYYGVRNQNTLYTPKPATELAAKILLDNYSALGDWDLAVNAYHSGQGNLLRAVEETGSKDICVIIENYKGKTFKFASKNYLGQFYAALNIINKKEDKKRVNHKTTSRRKR